MNYTLKQLLEVLDARKTIAIFKNEKDMIFNGLVYEALILLKENKIMNHEVKEMYISLSNVYISISEEY